MLPERPDLPISRFRAVMTGTILLGLVLALAPVHLVLSVPGGAFSDPDSVFHLRRAVRTVETGAILPPVVDRWENFPEGGRAVWPPLHDACLALFARLGGSTRSFPRRGVLIAAAMPVLQFALLLLGLGGFVKARGGRRAAFVTCLLATLTPAVFSSFLFGLVDHNGSEALGWLLLLILALWIGEDDATRWTRTALGALAWGALVLLCLGFFGGLLLAGAVLAGSVSVVRSWEGRSKGRVAGTFAAGFSLASLALSRLAALRVVPDPADPWRLGPPFTLALALGAVGLGALSLFDSLRLADGAARWNRLGLLAGVAGLVEAGLQPAKAWAGLAKGSGFLGAHDPWLATIDEFQSVLTTSGHGLIFAPAVPLGLLCVLLWLGRRRGTPSPEAVRPLAIAFLAMTVLALAQIRFGRDAALLGSLVAGLSWNANPSTAVRRRILVLGVVIAGAGAAFPFYGFAVSMSRPASRSVPFEIEREVGKAVRSSTPEPGPEPEWGVLAPWHFGHMILWESGRAVAVNNFGNFHPGFSEKLGIYLMTSPAEAVRELSRKRLRYVVTTDPRDLLEQTGPVLGFDLATYLRTRSSVSGAPLPGMDLLLARLYVADARPYPGDSPPDQAALSRFRKVWESPLVDDWSNLPRAKLFELLPAPPDEPGIASPGDPPSTGALGASTRRP